MQEEQEGMPDTLDESWDVDSSLDGWMLLRDTRGQTECVTTAFPLQMLSLLTALPMLLLWLSNHVCLCMPAPSLSLPV